MPVQPEQAELVPLTIATAPWPGVNIESETWSSNLHHRSEDVFRG